MFLLFEHARLRAGINHGVDVFGGELLLAHGGDFQQLEHGVGQAVEDPDKGFQQENQKHHRPHDAHGHGFGIGHGQPFGHQVGHEDEAAGYQNEGEQRRGGFAPSAETGEPGGEIGAHRRFADNTGQNRHGVEADLDDGDEAARLLLHIEHVERAGVAAVFGHHLQLDFARRGQREFGTGNECADGNQQHEDEKGLEDGHQTAGEWKTAAFYHQGRLKTRAPDAGGLDGGRECALIAAVYMKRNGV